ncbi:MAG: 50S ribosomal protein L7Ae [Candidatus Hodarchaeota archaeon]
MSAKYIRFETPKELQDEALKALEMARDTGKVKKGTNEATKSIERGNAKLVVIASDVEPAEVVMHLPLLCNEKKVPYLFVPGKRQLGRAIGIEVPAAAAAITNPGEAEKIIAGIKSKLETLGLK